MGYTHYWKNPKGFTEEQWLDFMVGVKRIFDTNENLIVNYQGEKGTKPKINELEINFNGIEDDSHENCRIEKPGTGFDFCKTAHKPYDKVVVEVLKLAKKINPDFVPSSDGGKEIFD